MAKSGIPYFKAWVIFTLLSVILAVFCGMAIGFVIGVILGIAGVPLETVQVVCRLAGLMVGFIASFAMFRWVVDRFIVPAILVNPTTPPAL
jgi:hypothetical protein